MNRATKVFRYLRTRSFATYLTSAYVAAALIVVHFHEMWRDEMQAWLIAVYSSTPVDLLQNMRYEGHPPLWHILLYVLSKFTHNPAAMQMLHVAIGALIVYLIARHAPFTKLQKVLLSFSYMLFYEYTVIARNYSLGVLFVVIFCVLMTRTKKNYWLIGIDLFLLSQTNAMAIMIMPALLFYLLVDYIQATHPSSISRLLQTVRREHIFVVAAVLGGLLLFYIGTKPPVDSIVGTHGSLDTAATLSTLHGSYVPIPNRIVPFWNTNILLPDKMLVGSFLIVVAATLFFARSKRILAFYLVGTATILGFMYFRYSGLLRHQEYMFLMLVISVWWLYYEKPFAAEGIGVYRNTFFTALLALQVIAGAAAVYKDVRLPFSGAKATAHYINQSAYANMTMAADLDYSASTVAGYRDKAIFYLQPEQTGTYIPWKDPWTIPLSDKQVVNRSRHLARQEKRPILLVLSRPLDTKIYQDLTYIRHSALSPVVGDEVYYLYELGD